MASQDLESCRGIEIEREKINIAVAGGACTGKSTLAAFLFARLKYEGFDYDLVPEESRKLKKEFGKVRSPFERLYLWRQQEREELRSTALDGFITDSPLFQQYASARMYAEEPRDKLAVRELFRMCLDIQDRYQLIVMAENPREIPYRTDQSRSAPDESSLRKHNLIKSFVEHFWPERLFFVSGNPEKRCRQVQIKLAEMRG